jgi:purine-nucleoside phosphorylase
MSTPHIDAAPGDFADCVLLPGDPLRARYIAEQHLVDARQVCGLRNMLGYTGHYRGRRVSVMGSGMGIPSLSIYANELVRGFGVRRLIRVGTCGALQPDLALGDLLLALAAGTDSAVNRQRVPGAELPAAADATLLLQALAARERLGVSLRLGTVFSTDSFYAVDTGLQSRLQAHGVLAVEMEAAGLYGLASALGVQALTLLAVSDCLPDGAAMPAAMREQALDPLIRLALQTAVGAG